MEIINVCDLPSDIYGDLDPFSDKGAAVFRAYCSANDCHYYARPRESFDVREAVVEAMRLGLAKVIVEDLS